VSREVDQSLVQMWAQALQEGQPAALLVRHAERGAIIDLARHHEILLTPEGHLAATRSGSTLRRAVGNVRVAVAHSPVERCAQTARGLMTGYSARQRDDDAGVDHDAVDFDTVGVVNDLGDTYLRDPARVAEAYRLGGKEFIRAWFDGRIDGDVIAPCKDVATLQVDALRGLMTVHRAVVAVSHDWNIAALREHALGARFEDVGWPEFLDGVVVRADGTVRCLKAPGGPGHPFLQS
jgi:broad specificity phosphatase PhoE